MKVVVVDASLVLALVLPDESSQTAEQLFARSATDEIDLLTTPIFELEVANGIHQAYRRRRIAGTDRVSCLSLALRLPIRRVEGGADGDLLFSLADRHGVSVYDAAYLALAITQDAFLATEDATLRKAARAHGAVWPG